MKFSHSPAYGARICWQAGLRVFGLHAINPNKTCGCGNKYCKAVGKHPQSSWTNTPVWDEALFDTWNELDRFESGYGINCAGLLVVDIDARNGGMDSYAKLLKQYPSIAATGLIVETGSGGGSKHLYFKCPVGLELRKNVPEFVGIDFLSGNKSYCVGPYSNHVSGRQYNIVHGSPADIDTVPQELIDLLRKPEVHCNKFLSQNDNADFNELAEMLSYINPDIEHGIWIRCGMAIHHNTNGKGFEVWNNWSAQGAKYPSEAELLKRWNSFGRSNNPVTIASLVYFAEQAGWERPVTFTPNVALEEEFVRSLKKEAAND